MTEDPRKTRDGGEKWDAGGSHFLSWRDFYRENYRTAYRIALICGADSATAEDALQEAFIALQEGLGRLRDEDAAPAYLKTTVRHLVLKQLVRERRRQVSWDVLDQADLPPVASAEKEALAQVEASALAEAVRRLPRREREVLSLTMLEHSPAEIAAQLGIEANAVRVHLHHARTKLRALLRSELIASLSVPYLAPARRRPRGGPPRCRPRSSFRASRFAALPERVLRSPDLGESSRQKHIRWILRQGYGDPSPRRGTCQQEEGERARSL